MKSNPPPPRSQPHTPVEVEICAPPTGLRPDACRERQRNLVEPLGKLGLAGAVLSDRRHLYYFTGLWVASYHTPLLQMTAEGAATLWAPAELELDAVAADRVERFDWNRLGTLLEDWRTPLSSRIGDQLPAGARIGFDRLSAVVSGKQEWVDLTPQLLQLRRAKMRDEVALVRHAIRGCEAAYARAAEIIRSGVREIDIYAEVQAAAVKAVGEPIGELGNDFQAGSGGGPPRTRKVEAGELMPLDVAVSVRGYRCDLCRTFVVGGEPTPAQQQAGDLVLEALAAVESAALAGASGKKLYDLARQKLLSAGRWEFPHHLGHGTGLGIHEAPRLNPHWDDVLTVGDLFTMEPGLYGDDLRGGVRIEENYWLTETGLERLSQFPRGLVLCGD